MYIQAFANLAITKGDYTGCEMNSAGKINRIKLISEERWHEKIFFIKLNNM